MKIIEELGLQELRIQVERNEEGYIIINAINLPGVYSYGITPREAWYNFIEALELYAKEVRSGGSSDHQRK